jgi:hypothetical protein
MNFTAPGALVTPELKVPVVLLSRYLYFLSARPISRSNTHYLQTRIHGLKSISRFLDAPEAADSKKILSSLTPANFREMAERLQLSLSPLSMTELPRNYFATDKAPPDDFVGSARRILLLLGPGIGIGDEIVTFHLPLWLMGANPSAQITVLTAYEDLWNAVGGVNQVATYRGYDTVIQAMRGNSELGPFELVVFVDFENPELYEAITYEQRIAKYAEISLGGRILVAVDNCERRIYRLSMPTFSLRSVYDSFEWLARGLGACADGVNRYVGVVAGEPPVPDGPVVVFVSPFTSKYDPSPQYWSRLLAKLATSGWARPLRIVLDTGPNLSTKRFSSEVARAAAAHCPRSSVSFEVAASAVPDGLSLADVFAQVEQAHVVICADSFTAHAAALTNATSLVLATPGLEYWCVPYQRSFRFDAQAPLADLSAAMRLVLAHAGAGSPQDHGRPVAGDEVRQLVDCDLQLASNLAGDAGFATLFATFQRFTALRRAVAERVAGWPAGARELVRDGLDDVRLGGLDAFDGAPVPERLHADAVLHIEDRWRQWRRSNLRKYLCIITVGDES